MGLNITCGSVWLSVRVHGRDPLPAISTTDKVFAAHLAHHQMTFRDADRPHDL